MATDRKKRHGEKVYIQISPTENLASIFFVCPRTVLGRLRTVLGHSRTVGRLLMSGRHIYIYIYIYIHTGVLLLGETIIR